MSTNIKELIEWIEFNIRDTHHQMMIANRECDIDDNERYNYWKGQNFAYTETLNFIRSNIPAERNK